MRLACTFIISLLPFLCAAQVVSCVKPTTEGVEITMPDGNLAIYPIADNAVRIKFNQGNESALPELIFISPATIPKFRVAEHLLKVEIKCKNISVLVDKQTGKLDFATPEGKTFLSEKAGSRKLTPSSVMNEPCFIAEQSFESPADEFIFGLGQFQDGHYNLKGITRRLTQVNTQIAIPFIYSNKGYGLLWHQYGLTDFNPADNLITLVKQEKPAGNEPLVEVTTTSGTQKVSQNQSLYTGKFTVPQDGEYSIFMDLGDMSNRHFVVIDGKPCLDQSNMWLPPTAGVLVALKAGEHDVQLICKSDNLPTLSWKLKDNTTTFRSPNAKILDYVVFSGSADEVIASYRNLTGNAPMFPKWAYGFWQCRERYTSGSHLVATVKEFRKRNLPLDVIVQDWQYWGSKGWGVPQFDEKNYPNPSGFIKELHDLNAHFNISIWSNPDKNSTIGKEYMAKSLFIPDTKWLDYFNPETRKEYWATLKNNMFDYGVDSWWMDAVEPENDGLKGTKTHIGAGDFYRLTYPLMVSQAVYEGQRATTSDKRVCILTRSAFLGQQRYGVINWSGDIGGTWDAFRNQIVAGLNFTITGLPYWTTDIGGFFRPGKSQYTDEKYQELLTRWFQWGTFNPILRIHGYQSETEPWKYGQTVEDNIRKMLDLRYRLLPYIYSEAWQVTKNGSTIMRTMVMDFSDDTEAVKQPFEYMFGEAFLVAPITEAMATQRDVYLPKSTDWYDFWTGKRIKGGQTIKAEAPLEKIPLLIKAGSIIPFGSEVRFATDKNWDNLEIRIYPGSNGEFALYEDENDNYNYEKGLHSTIKFVWNDSRKVLTIDDRQGSFPGMLTEREFNIVLVSKNKGEGPKTSISVDKTVKYYGKKLHVKLK
jgi:alpha-D-xyloside xylohydrolase